MFINFFSANNREKSIVSKSHNWITQDIMGFRVELKKNLLIIVNTINVTSYDIIILLKIRFPSKTLCVSISQTKSNWVDVNFQNYSSCSMGNLWKKTHKHTFFERFRLRKMHREVKKVNRNVFSDPVNRFWKYIGMLHTPSRYLYNIILLFIIYRYLYYNVYVNVIIAVTFFYAHFIRYTCTF